MKKRFLAFVLALTLALALAACGSSGSSSASQGGASNGSTSASQSTGGDDSGSASEWTGEVSKIVMTYLTLGQTPTEVADVEAAINAITGPKIGVEVEFLPVSAWDALSQYPMWISSNEKVDLMMVFLADVRSYAEQGLIEPLNDLVAEYGGNISALVAEGWPLIGSSYMGDEFYGVMPKAQAYGSGGSLLMAAKYMEEADIAYDANKIYTMADLTDLFAKIKANHPDKYLAGFASSGYTSSYYGMWSATGVDGLGATASSGVLIGTDSTEVVNLFATDEYRAYLDTLREWYLAGYIHPDVATTAATNIEWAMSDVSCAYPSSSEPNQVYAAVSAYRGPVNQLFLNKPYMATPSGAGGHWTIPISATEPEAAMRFLNEMYAPGGELLNLILWGIEGQHYVMVDESIKMIDFPEGLSRENSGYYNTLGLYGDRQYEYVWDEYSSAKNTTAYTERAMTNPTKGYGFLYNDLDKATQVAAINAVLAEYIPALEGGTVDVDTVLPEFLAKLEAAGIDALVADKQAQFDAWLADNG